MDEKTMVNDILAGVKSDLTAYQTAISESENMGLRQTFQQIRNNDESFQYELFKCNNKNKKAIIYFVLLLFCCIRRFHKEN